MKTNAGRILKQAILQNIDLSPSLIKERDGTAIFSQKKIERDEANESYAQNVMLQRAAKELSARPSLLNIDGRSLGFDSGEKQVIGLVDEGPRTGGYRYETLYSEYF